MWSIGEMKEKGKASMKANYWMSVAASLILAATTAGTGSGVGSAVPRESVNNAPAPEEVIPLIIFIFAAVSVALVIAILFDVFIMNPLEVGCQNFFRVNADTDNASLGELGKGFKPSWMNNVKTLFLRDLFLFLWSLLFVIPGIIKSYSYRMVPYIVADNPDINGTEAITLSRKMMIGHKFKAFLFDLSFIGWILLSILTCGILMIFFVHPYYYNASAHIYKELKKGVPELDRVVNR